MHDAYQNVCQLEMIGSCGTQRRLPCKKGVLACKAEWFYTLFAVDFIQIKLAACTLRRTASRDVRRGINTPGPDGGRMKRLQLVFFLLILLAAGGAARAQLRLDLPTTTGVAPEPGGSVQFIGTATVLIRFGGLTILTDPNFLHKGAHVHLGYGLTSQRLTEPAIAFEQLPAIDLVLLSHMHEDHFDTLVQQRLDRNVPIVTTDSAAKALRTLGFRQVFGLDKWQTLEVTKGDSVLVATAMPGRHGPLPVAALLPPVMGTMLDFRVAGGAYRLYVSGDTMVHDDIEEIPKRFPGIDLALLHLGGTRLLGIVTVTMDAADGVRMLKLVAPRHAIPIHYDDYDVFKSPLSDFQRTVNEAGLADKLTYLQRGDSYDFMPRPPSSR
jgi:L-ascorbate metabolism protein UlaG (beta-lactamase superfamily)